MSGLSMITFFALVIAFVICCREAEAVPVAMAMGCGKPGSLTVEKRAFCCEHFKLNCPASEAPLTRDSLNVRLNVTAAKLKLKPIRATVRLLGQDCKEEFVTCATGLYCRRGICVRKRSVAHMKSLLNRGRLVEKEEREEIDPDSNEGSEDTLGAKEELILRGQSLRTSQNDVPHDLKSQSRLMSPRKTPSPQPRVVISGTQTTAPPVLQSPDDNHNSSQGEESAEQIQLNEEEDEVAANIADLLSAKMGIDLTSTELHAVREIIAGTLDERAQREDEVTANQQAQGNDIGDADNLGQRVEAVQGGEPAQYHYYNHFEPLVQCSSERYRRIPSKDTVKRMVDRTFS